MGIAFGRLRLGPRRKNCDLTGRQRRVIRELAVARIGKPRRHGFSWLPGEWQGRTAGILIGLERHWRHFTLAMAVLAPRLENRQNIFVECRRISAHQGGGE